MGGHRSQVVLEVDNGMSWVAVAYVYVACEAQPPPRGARWKQPASREVRWLGVELCS